MGDLLGVVLLLHDFEVEDRHVEVQPQPDGRRGRQVLSRQGVGLSKQVGRNMLYLYALSALSDASWYSWSSRNSARYRL